MAGEETATLVEGWATYMNKIDEVADLERIGKLAPVMVNKGWKRPSDLVGAEATEVLEGMSAETNAPDRAFIRRCIVYSNQVVQAASQPTSSALAPFQLSQQSVAATQPELLSSLQQLLGTEQSALTVANAIAAGDVKPDVAKVLKDASLEDVDDAFCPCSEVFTALSADGKAAKKAGHVEFTYVELANQSLLPDWLPPEAVGGKTIVPGQEDCLSNYTGNLGQLGSALKALTTSPRFFRNIGQWSTAFLRYAVVAVSMKQITWAFVCIHMQVVLRVNSEEGTVVAVLYDELARKTWARRAAKGDQSLDLMTDVKVKDPQLVDLAKSKVKLVTRAAGLNSRDDGGAQSSNQNFGSAESALSKQVAMAQKVTKDAEAAVRSLNNQRGNAFSSHNQSGGKGQNQQWGGKRKQSWQSQKQGGGRKRGKGANKGSKY